MKTAISLPDSLYAAAEETAKEMGLPRSQLFAKALEEFILYHNRSNITEKYDYVYSKVIGNEIELENSISIENLRELTKNDSW